MGFYLSQKYSVTFVWFFESALLLEYQRQSNSGFTEIGGGDATYMSQTNNLMSRRV
jgi:hypothetical protein